MIYRFFFLTLILSFLVSCESQEVVNDVNAEYGELQQNLESSLGVTSTLVPSDESEKRIIQLENTGGFPISKIELRGLRAPLVFSGDEEEFPGEGGDCSDTLNPGESCQIELEITLKEELTEVVKLILSYNDGVRDVEEKFLIDLRILTPGDLVILPGNENDINNIINNAVTPVRFPRTKIGEARSSLFTIGNQGRRAVILKNISELEGNWNFTGGKYPGIAGNCGEQIEPLEFCLIELVYIPEEVEGKIENLTMTINNGLSDNEEDYSFSFEAVDERANLTFSISTIQDLGDIVTGDRKVVDFLVFNNTVVEADDFIFSFSDSDMAFTGGSFPGTNGNCGSSIGEFSFCTLEVELNANVAGAYSSIFNIQYNDNNIFSPEVKNSSITFNANIVSGGSIVLDPVLSANGYGVYGQQEVGRAFTHSLALRNSGGFDAAFLGGEIQLDGGGIFEIVPGGSCGTSVNVIEPGKVCYINVKVHGTITGSFTANLQITYENGSSAASNQTYDIPISITYQDTSEITYSGNTSFGLLPYPSSQTAERTFIFSNGKQGVANIVLDTAFLNTTDYSIISENCNGASLAINQTCSVTLRFAPQSAGDKNSFFELDITDPLRSYSSRVSISGESRTHANLGLRKRGGVAIASIDFETVEVNKSNELMLTLINSGGYGASNISVSNSDPNFQLSPVSCNNLTNNALAGSGDDGNVCTLKLVFTPNTATTYTDTIQIDFYNGEFSDSTTIPVAGVGGNIGFLEIVSPQNVYDLGDVTVDDSANQIVTLQNTGTLNIDTVSLIESNNSFQWNLGSSTCGGVLTPGDTCDVSFDFLASQSGIFNGTIFVGYETGGETKEMFIRARANALTAPNLLLTQQGQGAISVYNFGESVIGQPNYIKVLVSNSGQTPAYNILAGISGDSEFSFNALTCSNGTNVTNIQICEFFLIYTPTDEVANTANFTVSFDNANTLTVTLSGEGIPPNAAFDSWNEIYAVSGSTTGNLKIGWEPFIANGGVLITGYKVYLSTSPLPTDSASLAGFEVADIASTDPSDLNYSQASLALGVPVYVTVRGTYSGGVVDLDDTTAHLKLYIPPMNMALVHPYMVNQEFCSNMGLESEKNRNFGCPFTGVGNIDGYFNFGRTLLVDRYELSENGSGNYVSELGTTPEEFENAISASIACTGLDAQVEGVTFSKSLMRRTEYIAASAWPSDLSRDEVDVLEGGGDQNCAKDMNSPLMTGSRAQCVSKYGVYDLVGNMWEWNSDMIENRFGARSNLDATNEEIFGMYFGELLPGESMNQDCFSFVFGVPQSSQGSCNNGVDADSVSEILGENYYWPPLTTAQKSIRSGGGVGPSTEQTSREIGRWVIDMNQSLLSNVNNTAARCVIRF